MTVSPMLLLCSGSAIYNLLFPFNAVRVPVFCKNRMFCILMPGLLLPMLALKMSRVENKAGK